MPNGGIGAVRAVLTDAKAKNNKKPQAQDHIPVLERGTPRYVEGVAVLPGQWTPDEFGMPPDCPVQPLGKNGDLLYVVDTMGQIIEIKDQNFGQKRIQNLFGDRQDYLYWAFPRFKKPTSEDDRPVIDTFRAEWVTECFYSAGAKKGIFTALERVRGLGCWQGSDGALVYHAGDSLWVAEKEGITQQQLGEMDGGFFYPRRKKIFDPWQQPLSAHDNVAVELFEALSTWTWERPQVDAVLFMGWVGAAMLGGALPWRPSVFVTGDKAVGKSTLQQIIRDIFGDAILSTEDTTPAGIYSRVKQDSLPVAVDELEAEADNTRVLKVVALARLAASGGVMYRGGSNHVGTEFQARSCFFFSSINRPPLPPQDLSRIPILSLTKRDKAQSGVKPPKINKNEFGAKILRRLMQEWHRFSDTYDQYRDMLRTIGHDGRAQDTYGILLTCADLLLGDHGLAQFGLPFGEFLSDWGSLLPAEHLTENWENCMRYLLTSHIEIWRNDKMKTIGDVMDFLNDSEALDSSGNPAYEKDKFARQLLTQAGIGLVQKKGIVGWCLAIPHQSPLVAKLFRNTPWGGATGAGAWSSALKQGPPEVILRGENNFYTCKVNGIANYCVIVSYLELQNHFNRL